MGVTGLWTVLQPCARPVKLETLNKKRLAVDASIWIYQFLKAVRDKEGNALRNSHIVGFFRRICKLLFFGIKPVFVFDGGAPALKRQTITARARRREGRREDAVRTAGKLLAVQMQRKAEEERERRRQARQREPRDEEEEIPDDVVYVDELQMTHEERRQNRSFKKKDQYHLPDLDVSLEGMGGPDDPRIMSQEELEEYARQFHSGEDISLYDFSKIDFDSPFFLSLPPSDRYSILNAARLRSRLRMGYSKDQLDTMFPDRMAFSRFQIERVKERNDLTQRLMNLHGMNGDDATFGSTGGGRIAGERGKEYVLVKNEGVEGGWALGVVSNKDEGGRSKPIDVEKITQASAVQTAEDESGDDDDDDEGFEDVPIEGLNRLPKLHNNRRAFDRFGSGQLEVEERRRAVYKARKDASEHNKQSLDVPTTAESDSLFVGADDTDALEGSERQNVDALFNDTQALSDDDADDDLSRAIVMSLESAVPLGRTAHSALPITSRQDTRHQLEEKNLTTRSTDETMTSDRSYLALPRSPASDSDDGMDLQAALAESRLSRYRPEHARFTSDQGGEPQRTKSPFEPANKSSSYDGPLPFETLDASWRRQGSINLSDADLSNAGGFQKEDDSAAQKALPLPPWFSAGVQDNSQAQSKLEKRLFNNVDLNEAGTSERQNLRDMHATTEVIEVDSSSDGQEEKSVMDITSPPAETSISHKVHLERPDPADLSHQDEPVKEILSLPEEKSNGEELGEEPLEWPASDQEDNANTLGDSTLPDGRRTGGQSSQRASSRHSSPVFEDVQIPCQSPRVIETAEGGQIEEDEPMSPRFETIAVEEDAAEFSDPEDEQLLEQLAVEAEEHARFASSLNHKSQVYNHEEYERELRSLRSQQKKDRRDADEVSQIMITECQQLLRFFGLPYITAPMEAEAQCAELVRLGLVDGIVTDDSDCFLFGGTRVYKNMFNQAKFVECYLSSDLEKEFNLDRDKLIRFAHLLGSDYTEGIPGVGPVTALEILSEFDSATGLEDFKVWWDGVQMGKSSPDDAKSAFRKKFRRKATRFFLPPTFPLASVTQAYLHPDVDSSRTPFQWGVPDLDGLRAFLMSTIGWTQERTDEVLVPVIRDMNRRDREGTQSNLTAFFSGGTGAGAPVGRRRQVPTGARTGKTTSRRMEGALEKLQEGAKRKRRTSAAPDPVADGRDDVAAGAESIPRGRAGTPSQHPAASGSNRPGQLSSDDDSESSVRPVAGPARSTTSCVRRRLE